MSALKDQFDAFSRFVGDRLTERELSLEESLAAFRVYEAELRRFKQDVGPALADIERGETTPLDIDAIIARGRAVLANEGIGG